MLFVSSEKVYQQKEARIYSVSTEGGTPTEWAIPRAIDGQISADGKMIAYQQIGFGIEEWRNYRGGQAKPIWIVN